MMKYLRLIIISALVFFGLACIVSLFIPSQIRIFRMTNIAKGQDSLLNPVKDLAQWKKWFPGFNGIILQNSEVQNGKIIKASANGIMMSITEVSDSSVIVSMQKGSRPVIHGWQINKDPRKDSLALQAYVDFKLKWYPWEKFSSLLLDKTYGDMLSQSLSNLKNLQAKSDDVE